MSSAAGGPLVVHGTLPKARIERLSIRLPGRATLQFVAEALNPHTSADPVIPSNATTGLLTNWHLVRKVAQKMPEGYYVVRWVYEAGLAGMPCAPDDNRPAGDKNYIYGMDATVVQTPLGSHPKIQQFLCTYGGSMQQGQLIFPPLDPTYSGKRSGYDKSGAYFGNLNPFYGVDSYYAPQAILKRTKMTSGNSLPLDELYGLGYIDTPPQFPFVITVAADGNHANWIKSEASANQHGQDLELTESWRSGGIGGWAKPIYDPNWTPTANSPSKSYAGAAVAGAAAARALGGSSSGPMGLQTPSASGAGSAVTTGSPSASPGFVGGGGSTGGAGAGGSW